MDVGTKPTERYARRVGGETCCTSTLNLSTSECTGVLVLVLLGYIVVEYSSTSTMHFLEVPETHLRHIQPGP